jgi:TonB-linked SusC/RagA family outer membrane protein
MGCLLINSNYSMQKNVQESLFWRSCFVLNLKKVSLSILFACLVGFHAIANGGNNGFALPISGKIVDDKGDPLSGVSVSEKGTANATVSKADGSFSLIVESENSVLVITHIGYDDQEIPVKGTKTFLIKLTTVAQAMEDVVIIGYGRQKKASVLGSITQTTGRELERTGGVTNLGAALTGNLPGLVTTSSSGQPGAEDPRILIRAQTTWNGNGSPLILVDGIERPGSLGTLDITSIESISVLKDASATAVYGVKGANGVVLITTKKGVVGRPSIRFRANTTVKTASDLPGIYDAYDALALRNLVILREVNEQPAIWNTVRPYAILDKYRNPANADEWDRYPNVDWQKELFRNSTMSYNASANVSGGSQFVTYFAAVDYTYEGDLFKSLQNNRGYKPGFGYQRVNMRSNLDFNLTKTTKFTTRLFGSNGVRQVPWNQADGDDTYFKSAYQVSPEAFRPVYSDGTWGYFPGKTFDIPNSLYSLALSGLEKRTNTQLTTDFVLEQKLDMVTKGLSARASISVDNTFRERQRGISEGGSEQRKYIDPFTGATTYEGVVAGTQTDFAEQINWVNQAGNVDNGATYRRLNYIGQLNYARRFGKHDVSALGLFQREKVATGSEFPRYREDWVYRVTYSYDNRYLFETNGAYNGTEKYGPDYRFQFFPSISAGWTISNEKFIRENLPFLDQLKVRATWGLVGDDQAGGRFLYRDQWFLGGNTQLSDPGSAPGNTPYPFYRIGTLGNPYISWETVEKKNIGIEFGFLKGKISGSVDVFKDLRSDLLVGGGARAIPSYFGVNAPDANLGKASGKGYEIELRLNQVFRNGLRIWANASVTHAKSMQIFRDDAELLDAHLKQAGFQIGQTRAYQDYGYLQSWDDVYGSTEQSGNNRKYAGDYNILDFNADGVIDQSDIIPLKYSGSPQNTYNASIGFDWKGLSMFVQFYGVNNVTRFVNFPTFNSVTNVNVAYEEGVYWTKENGYQGDVPLPRLTAALPIAGDGTRFYYDGSYIRLKNAEIGYTLDGKHLNRIGVKSLRIYANGNNLALWTNMPDDRESNFNAGTNTTNNTAYPTLRRYNIGIDINL